MRAECWTPPTTATGDTVARSSLADDATDLVVLAAMVVAGYIVYLKYGAEIAAKIRGNGPVPVNTDMGGTDFGTDSSPGGGNSWGDDSPLKITIT